MQVATVVVARRQAFAVDAGLVELELVHALLGANLRMKSGLLWHLAQNCGMSARVGLPMNPLALFMETSGSSLVRSPPWQSAQLNPWAVWTSFLMSGGGLWRRRPWRSGSHAGILGGSAAWDYRTR